MGVWIQATLDKLRRRPSGEQLEIHIYSVTQCPLYCKVFDGNRILYWTISFNIKHFVQTWQNVEIALDQGFKYKLQYNRRCDVMWLKKSMRSTSSNHTKSYDASVKNEMTVGL